MTRLLMQCSVLVLLAILLTVLWNTVQDHWIDALLVFVLINRACAWAKPRCRC